MSKSAEDTLNPLQQQINSSLKNDNSLTEKQSEEVQIPRLFTVKYMLILTGLVFFFAMMSIVGGSLGILIYTGHYNMSTLWLNTGATLYSIYYIP